MNLPGVLLFTGQDSNTSGADDGGNTANTTITDSVVSVLCKLVRDPWAGVRSTLASNLSQLVWILGARLPSLKDEMVILFNDTEVSVLTCMVNAMVFIIDALARSVKSFSNRVPLFLSFIKGCHYVSLLYM